jgi:hypothetical protein
MELSCVFAVSRLSGSYRHTITAVHTMGSYPWSCEDLLRHRPSFRSRRMASKGVVTPCQAFDDRLKAVLVCGADIMSYVERSRCHLVNQWVT